MKIVTRLQGQAARLRSLNADGRVPLSRLGSLSLVGQGLNQSADVLTQKARLVSGFSKYVSDRILEKVVQGDAMDLHGQDINCAIMMADVRDFTNISSTMNPGDVVRLLNIYFEDMIAVLYKHGVHVDKFIGDGILAYVSVSPNLSAFQVCSTLVSAALDMLARLHLTNERSISEGLPQITAGIGLHFGHVVLGAIGSKSRLQYTIIGDSVNRAARIESLCKELGADLVISAELFEQLDDKSRMNFTGPELCTVKGLRSEIKVYTVVVPGALSGPRRVG
jgi:adenylate cyclase